jgi:hypothetical protein
MRGSRAISPHPIAPPKKRFNDYFTLNDFNRLELWGFT